MVNKNLLNATFQNNPSILSGYRNKIINGDFSIWQRGNSFNSTGYTADRWGLSLAGTGPAVTVNRMAFPMGDLSIPGNTENYWRLAITNGGDATNGFIGAWHLIENVRTFASTKVTLTFYARADIAGKKIAIGNPQSFGSSGDPRVDRYIGVVSLSTTWQKFQLVWTVNSIAGKTRGGGNDWIGLEFYFSTGSTWASRSGGLGIQTGTFDIARVSLVEGDATLEDDPFSARHPQQELALCQRYYYAPIATVFAYTTSNSTTSLFRYYVMYLPVQMRTTPTTSVNLSAGSIQNSTATINVCRWNLVAASATGEIILSNFTFDSEL